MFYSVVHDYDYSGAYHHECVDTFDNLDEAKKLFDEQVASAHDEFDGPDPHGYKKDSMELYDLYSHEEEDFYESDNPVEIMGDLIYDETSHDD